MCPECGIKLAKNTCLECGYKRFTTSTLNGKWPSDTWFQRARKRALMEQAQEIEAANDKLSKVQS